MLLLACSIGGVSLALADDIAKVTHLQGTLSVRHGDGSQALLALQSGVQERDVLTTEARSHARLKFTDDSELVLRPESTLEVATYRYQATQPAAGNAVMTLLKGGLRKVSGIIGKTTPANDVVTTPVATIGIRGTHYGLLLCQGDCGAIATVAGAPLRDGLYVDVVEGSIALHNAAGDVVVSPGQFAFVKDAASPSQLVPATDGVQVTLPPAIVLNSGNGTTLDKNNCNGNCAIE